MHVVCKFIVVREQMVLLLFNSLRLPDPRALNQDSQPLLLSSHEVSALSTARSAPLAGHQRRLAACQRGRVLL